MKACRLIGDTLFNSLGVNRAGSSERSFQATSHYDKVLAMDKNSPGTWPRGLLYVTLIATVLFFSARVYYRLTDDFRLTHIVHKLPHNPDWETQVSDRERQLLGEVAEQQFSYLGKGAQSYAFISGNGKYVLKFFKFKHLKPSWLVNLLPEVGKLGEIKQKSLARKERQIQSVFSGYKLAYDLHRREAGLLFVHLNPTNCIGKSATLYDKIGRRFTLDLDPYIFVLQERAFLNRDVMSEALQKKDLDTVKKRIDQIVALYLSEYKKGIYDRDHGVLHNMGFIGDRPIRLDVGKLTLAHEMKEQKNWESDLKIVAFKYHRWMKETHPEYYDEVMAYLEQELAKAFEKPFYPDYNE